jgi:hypothetical protein
VRYIIRLAVCYVIRSITMSKTFDNGMICASEQALIAEAAQMDVILAEFKKQGSYILSAEEAEMVALAVFTPSKSGPEGSFQMAPDCVGQSAAKIAAQAGIEVPPNTTLLIARASHVGMPYPLHVYHY